MAMERREQRTEVLYCTTKSIGRIQKQNTRYDEPYEGRPSRTVLWEAWGEVPLAYPAVEKYLVPKSEYNLKV
jgi:hypothetical protein